MKIFITLSLYLAFSFFSYLYAVNINCGVEVIEINYDDNISNSGYEWIKLQNRTGQTIDISQWKVGSAYANRTITQVEGWGDITNIPNGATFVICEPASGTNDFALRYSSFKSTYNYLARASASWSFGGKISISSQTELGGDINIQKFTFLSYKAKHSIVKVNFDADEDSPSSWKVGAPGGTPFDLINVSSETFPGSIQVENSPFNPSSQSGVIKFESENNAIKTISIYDIQGREVIRLVDADTTSTGASLSGIGKGNILWNGRNSSGLCVPVGIYIVYFETRAGTKTNRLKTTIAVGREF